MVRAVHSCSVPRSVPRSVLRGVEQCPRVTLTGLATDTRGLARRSGGILRDSESRELNEQGS